MFRSDTLVLSLVAMSRTVLVAGAGCILLRLKFLQASDLKAISRLILYFFLPCLAFSKNLTGLTKKHAAEFTIAIPIMIETVSISFLSGLLIVWWFKPPRKFRNSCLLAATISNCVDLPIAIYQPPLVSKVDQVMSVVNIYSFPQLILLFIVATPAIMSDYAAAKAEVTDDIHSNIELQEITAKSNTVITLPHQDTFLEHDEISKEGQQSGQQDEVTTNKSRFFKFQLFSAVLQPTVITLALSVVVALIDPLKGLFVPLGSHISKGKSMPPLAFLYNFATFLGDAYLPLGFISLGATIGSLNFTNVWKKSMKINGSLPIEREKTLATESNYSKNSDHDDITLGSEHHPQHAIRPWKPLPCIMTMVIVKLFLIPAINIPLLHYLVNPFLTNSILKKVVLFNSGAPLGMFNLYLSQMAAHHYGMDVADEIPLLFVTQYFLSLFTVPILLYIIEILVN